MFFYTLFSCPNCCNNHTKLNELHIFISIKTLCHFVKSDKIGIEIAVIGMCIYVQ